LEIKITTFKYKIFNIYQKNSFFIISLFQSLKMHEGPKAKVLDTKENCARAAQMEFSITTVDEACFL
jgi:hypothetical protein